VEFCRGKNALQSQILYRVTDSIARVNGGWVGEGWAYSLVQYIYISQVKLCTSTIKKCVMGLRSPFFCVENVQL